MLQSFKEILSKVLLYLVKQIQNQKRKIAYIMNSSCAKVINLDTENVTSHSLGLLWNNKHITKS